MNLSEKYPFTIVEQLDTDLWVVEEMGSNMFIIRGTEKVLLIDTAYGLTDIRALIRDLCGDLPVVVINSHEHGDHNSGNNQFDTVHVGRFGEPFSHEPMTEEGKKHLYEFVGWRFTGLPFDYEKWCPGPAEHVEPVQEGDVLSIGGYTFKVIETPGHSLGEIALFEESKRWLFTGDSVLTWEVWGQLKTSAALRYYAESLEKLAAYEARTDRVFPAHSVEERPADCGRFELPPRVLSVYARGTREIVDGIRTGRPYEEKNPMFAGCRYELFDIGGMAYDPERI